MPPAQISASRPAGGGTGGGYQPGDFGMLLALLAAAALLLWGAYIVMKLGDDFLTGQIPANKLFAYKVRVIVLIVLVVSIVN